MYRSGPAARRLLTITPLVQTGNITSSTTYEILSSTLTEKFASWLSRGSLSPELLRSVAALSPVRRLSAAPPPPPEPELARQESHLSGSSVSYVEEMYEAWSYDPKSVHASWDAYFRGGTYQAPPSLGRRLSRLDLCSRVSCQETAANQTSSLSPAYSPDWPEGRASLWEGARPPLTSLTRTWPSRPPSGHTR